jgi:hypothetical protein
MGPIGSGKSVACCMEIVSRAREQSPNSHGVRSSRWAVIRNTYPELKTTTIKTWQEWIPPTVCTFTYAAPITARFHADLPDGTRMELEIFFLALDQPQDVKKLLSLELTGVWVNEAREIPKSVIDAAMSRVGRYPSKRQGGFTWSGMIADTNPPDDDHWWYEMAEVVRPDCWRFFRQPPALLKTDGKYAPNPAAENIQNHTLGYDYYTRQLAGKAPEWIKVYLLGDYGTVQDGKPVYPEFVDATHISAEKLVPYKGLPLLLGWDFGMTPACVIGQLSPKGQLRVLTELVAQDMGIRRFVTDVVKPYLANTYPGMKAVGIGDPAGAQRAQSDERTCFMELEAMGLPAIAAATNTFTARREAVSGFLRRTTDGSPGFLMDPQCKVLRKGFNGGYKYERIQVSGEARYKEQPAKNSYSHPHDALQYLTMHCEQGVTLKPTSVARKVQIKSAAGWT